MEELPSGVLIVGHRYARLDVVHGVLKAIGLEVGLGHLLIDGGVGSDYAIESSETRSHEEHGKPIELFKFVGHAVSDPLAALNSMSFSPLPVDSLQRRANQSEIIREYADVVCDSAEISAMVSWYGWNKKCEARLAQVAKKGILIRRFQVEELLWAQEVALVLGLPWDARVRTRVFHGFNETMKNESPITRDHDWEYFYNCARELGQVRIFRNVVEMAQNYGYTDCPISLDQIANPDKG
jgi:hypothetical protein